MMNVSSINSGAGAGSVGRAEPREAAQDRAPVAPQVRRGEDQVELSEASRLLARLKGLPEIRQDLVDQVRAQIEAGTYESDDKLDQAIEGLLDDIESGL